MKLFIALCLSWFAGLLYAKQTLVLTSVEFSNHGTIPKKFSFKGENISPSISWSSSIANVKSYALIEIDYDAKKVVGHDVVHWVVYNIPAKVNSIKEGSKDFSIGYNSYNLIGYRGMNPPKGQRHNYHFYLFALDIANIELKNPTKEELMSAMNKHIIAKTEMVAGYKTE